MKQNFLQEPAGIRTGDFHVLGKIAKRVSALALAAGMLVPITFAATACANTTEGGTTVVNPDNPNQNTNPTDPTDPQNPGTPGTQTPEYSEYSQILQTVLTSDYYNDLLKNIYSSRDPNKLYFDGGLNAIEAIPYTFLESKGENLQDIKNNDIRVSCLPYVYDNDKNTLFNRVEITYDNGENDYIKQYLIKYKITNQEYEEIEMLYQGKYYQAQMFVQELDNQRDAELVSEFSINEKTYNGIRSCLNNQENINSELEIKDTDNFTVFDINAEQIGSNYNYIMSLNIMSKSNNNSVTQRKMQNASVKIHWSMIPGFKNNIFSMKQYNIFNVLETSASTPITSFETTVRSNALKNFIQ